MESNVAPRAAELLKAIEADTGSVYPLSSNRSEAFKKASDMFAAEGDPDQAARARIEWLVFAFRETESFGTGTYFGPRYTKSDGTPFPDFYSLPPNTRDYLKSRIASSANPLHRARYADFLWDKFSDAEAGAVAVTAYIECARLFASRSDGNATFRAIRRACHLAKQFKNRDLQVAAKDAAAELIGRMAKSSEVNYVPRVAEALMGVGEFLTPEERSRLIAELEEVRASFVAAKEFHLERGTLKALRQLFKLNGDEQGERKARLAEGESYEAEGDFKSREESSGGGPVVASHLYQLALAHFLDMGETSKLETLKKKIDDAHAETPTNFQQFVETLRSDHNRGTGSTP